MTREGIDLGSVRNLVCPKHERALAHDRGVNSVAFPVEVFRAAAADPRAQEVARAGEEGDLARLQEFLLSVAPVCEWITPEACAAAWEKAREFGIGARA